MKNLLKVFSFAAIALASTQSFAHPQDTDLLLSLGVGSKITVAQDINVLPGSQHIVLSEGQKLSGFYDAGKQYCYVALANSSDHDRVIRKGATYTVTSISSDSKSYSDSYYYYTKIKLDHAVVTEINCVDDYGYTSIGWFKQTVKGWLDLELAEPEVIQ